MTTLYFKVKGGIKVGNVIIDETTGNITGVGNAALGNLVTANYFSGSGNLLSNIQAGNVSGQVANALVAGTVYSNAQPNITSVGSLSSLNVTGNVTSGNVTGTFLSGTLTTAAQPNITSLGTLASLNVTANVVAGNISSQGSIDSTGNVTAPFFIGNVIGNISGTITVPGNDKAILFNHTGNADASDNLQFNYSTNVLTLVGNLTTNNANLGNLAAANYFSGNGASLTGLNASNLASGTISSGILGNSSLYVGTTSIALNRSSGSQSLTGVSIDGSAGSATTAGTVTTNAQPNITSVGTLSGLTVGGDATVTGNLAVTGDFTYVNVTTLDITDPIIELGGGANGAPLTTNDGKDRGTLLHYYDGSAINAFMGWDNSAKEFGFGKAVSVSGEVVTWTSYGNVHADYYLGNASALSGQIGNALVAGTVYTNAQPNITSVGTLSSLSVTGNLTAGNLVTSGSGGNISGADYVIANYFSGNGSSLTGLNASNLASGTISSGILGNSTVYVGTTSIALNRSSGSQSLTGITSIDGYAATVSGAAQGNITSVGTLNGLTVTGTLNATGASNVSLGPVANVHISGGSSGYMLTTDGSGTLSWSAPASSTAIVNGTSNVNIATSGGNVTTSVGGTADVIVVTSTGANIAGYVNLTGNLTAANAALGNLVSANFFSGNGSLLTSITGGNVTGTVSSATTAATVTTAAQPNITSVGTLSSVAVTGTATVGNINVTGGITSNRANVSVGTNTVIDEFAPSTYRTAKYVVSASNADGYQSAEIILVHNGSSSYISIYGSVCSNATADIVDFSSNINGVSGNVTVYATGTSATVNLVATYLKT
jgi:hypothetical protein